MDAVDALNDAGFNMLEAAKARAPPKSWTHEMISMGSSQMSHGGRLTETARASRELLSGGVPSTRHSRTLVNHFQSGQKVELRHGGSCFRNDWAVMLENPTMEPSIDRGYFVTANCVKLAASSSMRKGFVRRGMSGFTPSFSA